jgi:hypothetical protein
MAQATDPGLEERRAQILGVPGAYTQDGLISVHNHEFMDDRAFAAAYARGVAAAGTDYRWHWRVHIGLWAATVGGRRARAFVEWGVYPRII